MKVLITGLSGFVGQNLSRYLSRLQIEITALSREQLSQIKGMQSNNVDCIVHLAGKAHDLKKSSDPDEYYRINFELTKKLYDAFLKSDAKKFIFISSVKAVADSIEGVLTENVIPAPITHYGKSKLMAEQYIQSQTLPEGKSFYILRPCMIHGPGNKGNLNLLYKFVKKNIPYPLAAFENRRSFLSVENLCFVISCLLGKDMPSGIYQVADDEALSTNEVVEILAKSIDKKAKLWAISKDLIFVLAKIGDWLHLPINTERLHKLTENYIVSNEKIKSAFNLSLPIAAREGLLATANSFKTIDNAK